MSEVFQVLQFIITLQTQIIPGQRDIFIDFLPGRIWAVYQFPKATLDIQDFTSISMYSYFLYYPIFGKKVSHILCYKSFGFSVTAIGLFVLEISSFGYIKVYNGLSPIWSINSDSLLDKVSTSIRESTTE